MRLGRAAASATFVLRKQQQRKDLDGLAETHVIGEAGAEPETADEPQPGDAGLLIGPQRALQGGAWISTRRAGGPQGLQRLGEPRPGGDFRPAGAGGVRFLLGHRRAGEHPHRFGETHPLASGQGFGVAETRHRLFETGAIDLDPLAAQERQSVRSGEQGGDFRLRQRFAVERRLDPEIEQPVESQGRRLAAADCRRRLGARRPPGAPGRRHPQNHAGVLEVGRGPDERERLLRSPPQGVEDLARVDHMLQPIAFVRGALNRLKQRQKLVFVFRPGIVAQRLAQRQMLGFGGGREARRIGRHEGEREVRIAAVFRQIEMDPADEGPGWMALGEETLQIRPSRRKGAGEGGVQRLP